MQNSHFSANIFFPISHIGEVFACKINGNYLLLHEDDVPEMTWLRGKIRGEMSRSDITVSDPKKAWGLGSIFFLDLDWMMIDGGAIREIPPEACSIEKVLMHHLLSLLQRNKESRLHLHSFAEVIQPYRDIADYLGIAAVSVVKTELKALMSFPREDCTYIAESCMQKYEEIWFLKNRVVVRFENKVWKLPWTVHLARGGNVLILFAWSELEEALIPKYRVLEGIVAIHDTKGVHLHPAYDVVVEKSKDTLADTKIQWEERSKFIKVYDWTMIAGDSDKTGSNKRPREADVVEPCDSSIPTPDPHDIYIPAEFMP